MAPARRGGKGSSSTPKLAILALLMLLLGLGAGWLLSRSSCARPGKRPVERKGRTAQPAPKPKRAEPAEPREPEPEAPPRPAPEETPVKPPKPVVPPKPDHEPAQPEKTPVPAKPPEKLPEKRVEKRIEKQPAPPAKAEKAQAPEAGPRKALPRFALVIDDLGYAQLDLVKRLCKEPVAFSVAVLPYQEFTRESADLAAATGKEVILHLPMEPLGYPGPGKDPGPNAVMFDLKESEIRARVRAAFETVPRAVGANNHMGSRITPDRSRMTWILQEIKARRGFFLDSRTEKDSVAFDVARALKIPTVQRKVFLDDDKSFAEMSKQWERAIEIAKREGEVVIIGHIYPETVEALERLIPAAKGRVRFVKVSELTR